MGLIGEILASQIKKSEKYTFLQDTAKNCHGIGGDPHQIKNIKEHIEQGMDPLHAAYVIIQHFTSIFAESFSSLSELKAYSDIVGSAEEEYMPSGPPMSPITASYFTCWAFYALQFGPDKETIGTCLLDITNQVDFPTDMRFTLELMQNSRMGMYSKHTITIKKMLFLSKVCPMLKRACPMEI
jgi:hypothetical protein